MSETKRNSTAPRELEHASKKDKDLFESMVGEDSGIMSSYSHDKYSQSDLQFDDNLATSKGTKQAPKESECDSGVILTEDKMTPLETEELVKTFDKLDLEKTAKSGDMAIICYQKDIDGDTQLHISVLNESPQITERIIQWAHKTTLLDIVNDYGQAAIHLAVLMGQSLIVRRLLISGAKATIRDYEGNTPLHLACKNNDLQSVLAILAPITSAELKEYRSLSNQLEKNQRIPIDLEQRNYFGEHCIHIAVQNNSVDILQHLLEAGADINAREGRGGYTPLHIAVENQNDDMVKFLLKNGTDKLNIETLSYGQLTAYQLAYEYESDNIMCQLEEFGCEPLPFPESDNEDSAGDMDTDD